MHNRKGARYNTEHPNLSKMGYRFVKMYKKKFVKFSVTLAFLIALTTEEEIGPRSGRAGPSFSARPEKEAKGAVLHGTSATERFSRALPWPSVSAQRRINYESDQKPCFFVHFFLLLDFFDKLRRLV